MSRKPKRNADQILADMKADMAAQVARVERAARIKAMREPFRAHFKFVSACLVKNDKARAEGAITYKCHAAIMAAYKGALTEIETDAAAAAAAAKAAKEAAAAKAAKEAAEAKADEAGDL
jgi:hypothetical protein